MAYKILTKNGVRNSNIDGARNEHFNSGQRSGIVKGVLTEGVFATNASNSIYLDKCELRLCGHPILIYEPEYRTFTNFPATNTRYSFVAQVIVDDNEDVNFSIVIQPAGTRLIQDKLYENIHGAGTFQLEIGKFTLQTDGTIADIVKTADIITGNKCPAQSFNVGEVETEVIDYTFPVEVDVDERFDDEEGKHYLDFKFCLPLDFTELNNKTNISLANSQNAVQVSNAANGKADIANDTASRAEEKADTANATSNRAEEKANNAVATATNAQNDATDAKTVAQNALDTVIAGRGTRVLVNGEVVDEFNADNKADNTEVAKKVDKPQGTGNANKVMITDASGNITPSNSIPIGSCKCYTETDATTGEVSFVIEFPD